MSEDIRFPFWSPDGRFVAFFAGLALKRVDVADGTTQTVCPLPLPGLPGGTLVHGGTWGPDDVILLGWSNNLYSVPASGGTATPLGRDDSRPGGRRWPEFLPGGHRFLYSLYPDRSDDSVVERGVYVASLDGGAAEKPIQVMPSDYPARYAEPGYLLFVRDGVLLAQRFDADTASLQGTPVTLAPRVAVSPDVNFRSADFSVGGGALVYRTGWSRSRLTWLDRSGKVDSVIGEPDNYVEAELSPDGTRIALEISEGNGLGAIWVMDAVAGTRVPLTRTLDEWEYAPRWSPDGRHIAYSRFADIYSMLADGSGGEVLLARISPFILNFSRQWTPDGRSVVFTKLTGGLFSAPASTNSQPSSLPGSSNSETNARVSPDGRWLAYTSAESGRREVYVRPFGGGARRLISTAGGGQPLWHRKGTELYYQAADGSIMVAAVKGGSTFDVSAARALFSTRPTRDELRQSYSTIDGERFLVRTPDASTPPSIAWLVNWPALVEGRR